MGACGRRSQWPSTRASIFIRASERRQRALPSAGLARTAQPPPIVVRTFVLLSIAADRNIQSDRSSTRTQPVSCLGIEEETPSSRSAAVTRWEKGALGPKKPYHALCDQCETWIGDRGEQTNQKKMPSNSGSHCGSSVTIQGYPKLTRERGTACRPESKPLNQTKSSDIRCILILTYQLSRGTCDFRPSSLDVRAHGIDSSTCYVAMVSALA